MTAPSIAAIKARLAMAAPGPWRVQEFVGDPGRASELGIMAGVDRIVSGDGFVLNKADADLIASAPSDIRFLLADVERLEASAAAMRDVLIWARNEAKGYLPDHFTAACDDTAGERLLDELLRLRDENARLAAQLLQDGPVAAAARAWAKSIVDEHWTGRNEDRLADALFEIAKPKAGT